MMKSIIANLMVENVEEAIAFYQETLGFTVVTSVPHEKGYLQFAIVAKDTLMLMLQERENFVQEYPILGTEKTKPSISLFITVDNFNELYQSVKGKVQLLADIHTTFYGTREFAIADNSGYVITIAEQHG